MDNLFMPNASEDFDDLPQTENYVWILGKKYNSKKGKFNIKFNIQKNNN